jgi:hypothetical protein
VFALVMVEVDVFGRFPDGLECAFFNGRWAANKGDDGAVVIRIGADIQNVGSGDIPNGAGDSVDDIRVTAVAEVRNTFDDLLHKISLSWEIEPGDFTAMQHRRKTGYNGLMEC